MKRFSFLSALALTACSSETGSGFALPGIESGGESDDGGESTGMDDDGDDGSESGSGDGEGSGDETDGTDGGSGSDESTDNTDDATDSSNEGSSSENDSSSSESNTTTGQIGEEKFPGDWCDPFVDWCADIGDDYECMYDSYMLPNYEYESIFTCQHFNDIQGDGTYEDMCNLYPYEQCRTGFLCISTAADPNLNCATSACCVYLCKYQEICLDGQECEPMIWQADLADYLDSYVAIGYCPS